VIDTISHGKSRLSRLSGVLGFVFYFDFRL
jgi:hypothetical protein